MNTPWGPSDNQKQYAPGITFYSTPSHGGFKLSFARERELDAKLREVGFTTVQARMGYDAGWYEEDCSAAAVMFAWPDLFGDKVEERRSEALAILTRWINS